MAAFLVTAISHSPPPVHMHMYSPPNNLGSGNRILFSKNNNNVNLNINVRKYVTINTTRSSSSSSRITCLKGYTSPPPDLLSQTFGTVKKIVTKTDEKVPSITRQDFPLDFKFGCSTSALQTEGHGDEGGRGPSTWDILIGTGFAVDSYHRYKEDVQLLKNMGVDTYRFSISWSRILPDGTIGASGGINQAGIDFYNNLIDELISNGITPFATLFHFDLPQALLDKYNGFLSSQIVDDFTAYADICFTQFGDRVQHWGTVNEPQAFGQYGYSIGMDPEDVDGLRDPFIATHNIILAHASVVKLYNQNYKPTQQGEIGISLMAEWFEPYDEKRPDIDGAHRAFDFFVGWLLEPLVFGDYPFSMKALVGDILPIFTDEEKEMVTNSFDYIGINYYTSRYAIGLPIFNNDSESFTTFDQFQRVEVTPDRDGVPIGPLAPGSDQIYVYPKGLRDVLVYISRGYNNPKLYVTENGYPEKRDDSIPIEVASQDDARIEFTTNHLNAILEAIKLGVDVKAYIMWALMDCMEVGSFYEVRFGLNYTDFTTLDRSPKKSAYWFKNTFLGLES